MTNKDLIAIFIEQEIILDCDMKIQRKLKTTGSFVIIILYFLFDLEEIKYIHFLLLNYFYREFHQLTRNDVHFDDILYDR